MPKVSTLLFVLKVCSVECRDATDVVVALRYTVEVDIQAMQAALIDRETGLAIYRADGDTPDEARENLRQKVLTTGEHGWPG